MADIYELRLALHLPGSLAPDDLALLRWHLGLDGGRQSDSHEYPLWEPRGAALRIGGALVGELHSTGAQWALTVRQETHPDEFDDLRGIVQWLGARTTTTGTVGYLRFHEAVLPDVLVAEGGAVRREVLRADTTVRAADQVIPGLHA